MNSSSYRMEPWSEVMQVKGVSFPEGMGFRQLLVTGPPGVGKSTLMSRVGGWIEEGYVDLTAPGWWASRAMSFRPREIHLGLPFLGIRHALAVFDEEWLDSPVPLALDFSRILLPPEKRYFFSIDWRRKYVFEFILPPPELVFAWRQERARRGTHQVDRSLSLEIIQRQIETYRQVALYFAGHGITSYIREEPMGLPIRILPDPEPVLSHG